MLQLKISAPLKTGDKAEETAAGEKGEHGRVQIYSVQHPICGSPTDYSGLTQIPPLAGLRIWWNVS